ncbi:hypothetical protein COCOBI_18-1000 [Coccomyxa sp. Obi]|nr:hypothetical protein COCOBI_18-1000 [Coccomyxa sp. Obi]
MDYHPNCCRRVLQELQPIYYPIGNTRSFSVFHAVPGDVFEALFLGCGDVRNVLATARDASKFRSLKHLTVHINDKERQIIARAALLLLLASELDAGCEEDMHFLWDVWYCLDLSHAQNSRLKKYLDRLMAGDYGKRVDMNFSMGEEAVRGVWRGWIRLAAGAAPSPGAIRREREAWIVRHVANKTCSHNVTAHTAAEGLAAGLVTCIKPFMNIDGHNIKKYQAELRAYHVSGAAHLGGDGGERDGWVTNPTLLHPATGAWEVHYAALPYASFFPFDQGEDISTNLRYSTQIAKVCIRKFTELVAGFQACAASVKISVRLWLMDAVYCCDWGPPVGQLFNSVDTSNLADNVELLNLLLMAGPRLKKTPYSRLYARTMVWKGSLRSYLDSSLGVPPEMMPAMFGLRLLTDLTLGTPPFQDHPPLEWALALWSTSALHISSGEGESCGVRNALKALASRCCRPKTSDTNLSVNNVLIALTPLSLALAVVSAATRVAGIFDPSKDWRANADALFRMLAVPACMRLEWNTWMCWLLHGKVAVSPNQAPEEGPNVRVYSCRLQMMPTYTGAWGAPMLRVVLMDATDAVEAMMEGIDSLDKTILAGQQLNSVCFDTATHEVAFLLQERLHPMTAIVLVNMSRQVPLSIVIDLANVKSRAFNRAPPLCARPPLATPITLPTPPPHFALMSVVEHANHYVATLGFNPDASGDRLKIRTTKDDHDPALCANGTSISIPGKDQLPLHFAWPINVDQHKLQRSHKRGILMCTLPKGSSFALWPGDAKFLPKLAPHGLPELTSERLLRCAMGFMFVDVESASSKGVAGLPEFLAMEKTAPKDPVEAALYHIRETIEILFMTCFTKQTQHHVLDGPGDEKNRIRIIVHEKVRMLPDGRPVLQVSYSDQLELWNQDPDYDTRVRAVQRLAKAVDSFVVAGPTSCHHIICEPGELAYFREVLLRNSARTLPSKAQSEVLELPSSEWRASFLMPLYLQRHDTKGGDIVEAGEYVQAAASYACGLSMLDELGSPEDAAHRELRKSLLLNRAAANIKDAEQELGSASAIVTRARPDLKNMLEEAVVSCSGALDIDPRNAKALYRQAQALVRLGLDMIAEDRLMRALKIEKGDAVMQTMLEQIQQRLKKTTPKTGT